MSVFHLCLFADATTEKPQIQTPVSAAKNVESDVVEILIWRPWKGTLTQSSLILLHVRVKDVQLDSVWICAKQVRIAKQDLLIFNGAWEAFLLCDRLKALEERGRERERNPRVLPSEERRAELPFLKIKQTVLGNLSWLTSESEVLVQDSAERQEAAVKWHKNI